MIDSNNISQASADRGPCIFLSLTAFPLTSYAPCKAPFTKALNTFQFSKENSAYLLTWEILSTRPHEMPLPGSQLSSLGVICPGLAVLCTVAPSHSCPPMYMTCFHYTCFSWHSFLSHTTAFESRVSRFPSSSLLSPQLHRTRHFSLTDVRTQHRACRAISLH